MWSSSLSSPSVSFLGLYPYPLPTPLSHLLLFDEAMILGFPGGPGDKESACQRRRHKRCGFDPWARKIPWKRKGHPSILAWKTPWRATFHGVANSQTQLSTHIHKAVILLACQPVSPTHFWEATFSHLMIWTTWDTRHSPPWLPPQVISWFCHLIFSSLPARCPFPPSRHGFYIFI